MKKPIEVKEDNYIFTIEDIGPPDKRLIRSVTNPLYNSEKLSVNDTVLIKDHLSEFYNCKGLIKEIILSSQDKNKNGILKISIKKELISFRLEQVKKLPS